MREKIINAVLEAIENVLGLPQDEMREQLDLDLFENELIDSLGCASLISEIEELLDKDVPIENFDLGDFKSINTLVDAVAKFM